MGMGMGEIPRGQSKPAQIQYNIPVRKQAKYNSVPCKLSQCSLCAPLCWCSVEPQRSGVWVGRKFWPAVVMSCLPLDRVQRLCLHPPHMLLRWHSAECQFSSEQGDCKCRSPVVVPCTLMGCSTLILCFIFLLIFEIVLFLYPQMYFSLFYFNLL